MSLCSYGYCRVIQFVKVYIMHVVTKEIYPGSKPSKEGDLASRQRADIFIYIYLYICYGHGWYIYFVCLCIDDTWLYISS